MTTSKKTRMDLAFAALLSDDDTQVLEALTRIGQDGDARAIRPLLKSLARTRDPKIQHRIAGLLYEVKAKDADAELFAALEDPTLLDVRTTILATFWNAGIDVRDHLERFITLATEGDADECFECLTIIENQEIWPEKAARVGLARIRKAVAAVSDEYKATMLRDIQAVLEDRLGIEPEGK
jgi:hypothetical protein